MSRHLDRWDVVIPGFTEIDLVAHCGSLGDGEFVHSLNLTDLNTTWVETAAVLGKSQVAVQAALDEPRQALPFRLRGPEKNLDNRVHHALLCGPHSRGPRPNLARWWRVWPRARCTNGPALFDMPST